MWFGHSPGLKCPTSSRLYIFRAVAPIHSSKYLQERGVKVFTTTWPLRRASRSRVTWILTTYDRINIKPSMWSRYWTAAADIQLPSNISQCLIGSQCNPKYELVDLRQAHHLLALRNASVWPSQESGKSRQSRSTTSLLMAKLEYLTSMILPSFGDSKIVFQ